MVQENTATSVALSWETGIDIYTLLCIKLLTKKDILYSTENSTQYSVIVYMGKESKKEWIYVYAEKAMAPHSSTLAWKIPRMEEPGRLHAVHGVAESRTRLSDFTFTFHLDALEEEMATHSSVPAWRIPGTGEPGGLPSMGLHRVGHD